MKTLFYITLVILFEERCRFRRINVGSTTSLWNVRQLSLGIFKKECTLRLYLEAHLTLLKSVKVVGHHEMCITNDASLEFESVRFPATHSFTISALE